MRGSAGKLEEKSNLRLSLQEYLYSAREALLRAVTALRKAQWSMRLVTGMWAKSPTSGKRFWCFLVYSLELCQHNTIDPGYGCLQDWTTVHFWPRDHGAWRQSHLLRALIRWWVVYCLGEEVAVLRKAHLAEGSYWLVFSSFRSWLEFQQ